MAYLIAVTSFSLAWVAQLYVVFPLEQFLRGESSAVNAFSYVFLPHGVKVLIALLFMQMSIPIIFSVSFMFGLFFGFDLPYAMCGAVIAAITAVFPLWPLNLTPKKKVELSVLEHTA